MRKIAIYTIRSIVLAWAFVTAGVLLIWYAIAVEWFALSDNMSDWPEWQRRAVALWSLLTLPMIVAGAFGFAAWISGFLQRAIDGYHLPRRWTRPRGGP